MNKKRLLSIKNYLSRTDYIHKWKFEKGICPLCKRSVFISLKKDPFFTRCLKCSANITNLSLIPVIEKHIDGDYNKTVYELSSYGSTFDYLISHFSNVVFSEYFPDKEPGSLVDGILNQDVQSLTFEDRSVDVITSNQVFEHVPDDIKGFSECYRVLKNNGALIFSVPLYETEKTKEIAFLKNGQIVFDGIPEYHDSRMGGPFSAPVFRYYSLLDIC